MAISRRATLSLRGVALLYLTLLLLLPVGLVFWRTFEHGIATAWSYMTTPAAISAFWLTVLIAVIAVPLNTIFGVGAAMVLARTKARGRSVLDALIDLPFVVRSVQPVLIELDQEVEEAAASLGASNTTTFRRIVLPALRPAIFSGAALAFARSIGEFGSLALIAGKVQIASIVIYADIESGSEQSAAALSVVLMLVALIVLFIFRRIGSRIDR